MQPPSPPRTPLRAWSNWASSAVDARLFAAQDAQRALLRAPYALFGSSDPMPPAIETVVRVQDAMTRTAYQSLVALNRLAGALSGQLIDRFDPPPRNDG
jgi:hypothetical protein